MNVPETFFSVSEELVLFGLSCLFGAVIGVCYDVFRTARLIFPHNSWLVLIEDIAFLAAYAVFISAFSSAAARGELRFYFFIGNALGFILYILTLGSIVIRTMEKLFFVFKTVFSALFRPFKRCYVFLRKKAAVKFVGSSKVLVNYVKKTKKLLQKRPHVLYNSIENKKRKNVKNVAEKNQT